ncbi:ABC transporter related protein, partial [Burkholderia sp. TJI49]
MVDVAALEPVVSASPAGTPPRGARIDIRRVSHAFDAPGGPLPVGQLT